MNRTSSGRLIQISKTLKFYYSGGVSRHTTNPPFISSSSGFNSFKSITPRPYTRRTEIEKPRSIYYEVEDEAKQGSNCDPVIVTTNDTYIKKLMDEEVLTSIKEGDGNFFNLSDLLFSKNRDYLIKCNDGQRVKAEHFVGKVVVLYFDSVMEMNEILLAALMQIYKDLQPNNNFEVVFVDVNDGFGSEILYYEDMTSHMPWTAIPLSDVTFRKHLKRRFAPYTMLFTGTPILIDPTGMILPYTAKMDLLDYGALGYPFSNERIDFLNSKDADIARQPSLQTLLASAECDYLISSKGDKVPIHTLEDKVVALYFYEEGFTDEEITEELKMAYKELGKNNKKFEVVLIYDFDGQRSWGSKSEESFWKTLKTMPWLALPFDDSHHRMLKRIFRFPYDWDYDAMKYALIIIGPHFEFIEPYGVSILQKYKTSAYPFSRDAVAKLITKEANELKLEMLWDPNSVFGGKFGSQVRFSQLAGKRVVFFFDWGKLSNSDARFVETLKERYIHMKGTEDEFEVIHITKLSAKTEHVANLPWFVQCLGEDYTACLSVLFDLEFIGYRYDGSATLIAFDRDGSVVRKTVIPSCEDMDFPFYAGGLEDEAVFQLFKLFGWDCLSGFPDMIYSYKPQE